MSPQEESLDILVGFLSAYKYMKVKGIDLDTIGELASSQMQRRRSIRLIENTIHAPTTKISKCLNHIIRPIFNDKCDTTTIIDGAFLIKGLNKSIRKRLFKPSTLFCTCGIGNLYTMSPQEESLDILVGFLSAYKYMKVKGIDLDTIGELASIVRQENIFVYGKRMYKQIISGAMGSSFTLTLANTFMWKWQKEFIRPDTIMVFYQH
ncbi:unnamed protein product [Didymodactylos carnosus]|uniref:Uncharacterized protein n=1 Tax=Didymodactylos carnosus TaxID=1234261 RepID=A0A8S2J7V3_9BILA|nr:unnamed protein product [Didymodactylos carnosus]CAF3797956.1 unnamed protein product [Didymodactylos carnosus]